MRNMKKIILGLTLLSSALLAENKALIIGCCDDYAYLKKITPLYGTQNDARHIFDTLVHQRKAVKKSNATYLVGENATYKNITQSLKAMGNSNLKGSLKRGDTLYLYYSGHGTSLSDRGYFGKKLKTSKAVMKWIENSAGFVPYDFNPNNILNSLIITKRDFKPTFERLDARGINIVWIADACYAGNAYRSGNGEKQKFVKLDPKLVAQAQAQTHQYNKESNYRNLLFYGASLTTLPTQEKPYRGETRGEFSIEVEKCLNKSYANSVIKHKDFKKCLQSSYSNYAYNPAFVPLGHQQGEQVIIKASQNVQTHASAQSYKEKLFSLQNNQALLNMSIKSPFSESEVIKTFCKGERLSVTLDNNRGQHIIALSKDKNGRVIMIHPNKNAPLRGNQLFQTEVQEPFGTDYLKVFTTNDSSIFNTVQNYSNRKHGVLSATDIEMIYKALSKTNNFRTAQAKVNTISRDVQICKQGDRQ